MDPTKVLRVLTSSMTLKAVETGKGKERANERSARTVSSKWYPLEPGSSSLPGTNQTELDLSLSSI